MKTLRFALLLLALCVPSSAQTVTDTIDSLGDSVVLNLSGRAGATAVISSVDLVGTLNAEASLDGTNWVPTKFSSVDGATTGSFVVSGPLVAQGHVIVFSGGFVRVVASAYTSGSAEIILVAGDAPTSITTSVSVTPLTGGGGLTDEQLRATPVEVDCPSCSGGGGGGLTDAELRASPVPVSGTVGVSGTVPVSGPLTDAQLRVAAVPVDGSAVVQPVSGPVTDSQLRATPVPVSGTVGVSGTVPVSGPLTDTQLRATPVPVSGFPSVQPVSDNGGSLTVDGPLTDAQLRASAVPVSGTVGVSGTVPVSGPLTDVQLRATAVPVSGSVTAVGPLTDTQLRATPVPVSMGSVSNVTDALDSAVISDAVTISAVGSSRILVYTNSAFGGGGAIATPEATVNGSTWVTVPLLRSGIEDEGLVTALTSANWTAGSLYVFNNYGVSSFRIRVTTMGSPGSNVVTLAASGSDAPGNVQMVTTQRTNTFSCTMSSTATTLTEVTGCGAPSGFPYPVRRYITGIQWSSSIISTTANFMLLRAGTGANCGTGTVDVWRGFSAPAFNPSPVHIGSTAIPLPLGNALCFIHAGAGTRFVNIQGYVAP